MIRNRVWNNKSLFNLCSILIRLWFEQDVIGRLTFIYWHKLVKWSFKKCWKKSKAKLCFNFRQLRQSLWSIRLFNYFRHSVNEVKTAIVHSKSSTKNQLNIQKTVLNARNRVNHLHIAKTKRFSPWVINKLRSRNQSFVKPVTITEDLK